jgi:hypothetical protein
MVDNTGGEEKDKEQEIARLRSEHTMQKEEAHSFDHNTRHNYVRQRERQACVNTEEKKKGTLFCFFFVKMSIVF